MKGVIPMTLFGGESLDVEDIDLESIELCRADDPSTLPSWEYEQLGSLPKLGSP